MNDTIRDPSNDIHVEFLDDSIRHLKKIPLKLRLLGLLGWIIHPVMSWRTRGLTGKVGYFGGVTIVKSKGDFHD